MAYIKKYPGGWKNKPNQTTPASADAFDHMETQYDEAIADVIAELADPEAPVGAAARAGIAADVADPESEVGAALSSTFAARRVRLMLCMGQSNMRGEGSPYSSFTDPQHPRIKQYPASGASIGSIIPASEPLAMHEVHDGMGPALQFARHWIQTLPADDVILIIPAAHGGTMLSTNTTPLGWRWGVSGNLTQQAITQTQAAITAARAMYPGATVTVEVVLWVQGEHDGTSSISAATYTADLDLLIAGLRTTFADPTLPFIIGQIVPEGLAVGTRGAINAAQASTPYRVAFTGFSLAEYGTANGDNLHFSGVGQRRNAKRMFAEYVRVKSGLLPVNSSTGDPINVTTPDPGTVPVPVNGVVARDTFTRTAADLVGTMPDLGDVAWTGLTGRFAVNGTKAIAHATGGTTGNRLIVPAVGDMKVTAVLDLTSAVSPNKAINIGFNSDSTEANRLIASMTQGATNLSLRAIVVVAGVSTTLATNSNAITDGLAVGSHTVVMEVAGLAFTIHIDGVLKISATLTTDQKAAVANNRYITVTNSNAWVDFAMDSIEVAVNGFVA